MAKRITRTARNGTAATELKANGNGRMSGNGENRPPLSVKTNGKGQVFSHVRQKWFAETPEERVRQAYVVTLHNEYGFDLDQMDEELQALARRGSGRARADVAIWRTAKDKADRKAPLIVVECKADNITIKATDYNQGEAYALYTNAPFFVTHNNRETKYWRTRKELLPGHCEEIENIPHATASDKEIQELIAKLKTFKEDEFADLLHSCHNVIRNREHLDPAAAFDEIAKVLFVKVWVERELRRMRQRQNLFTVDWLDSQVGENPLQVLFDQTKEAFREDRIFGERERLNLKLATGREIVRQLERYNLSDTSEDVKGIAFERFLGKTFRGEIGQFFTPRTIVEFMVRMVEPKEGDKICDPASGSGGFLIRFFDIVRQQILADADQRYRTYEPVPTDIKPKRKTPLTQLERAELLRKKYDEIQFTIDQRRPQSRIWKLSNTCIFGTDANDRMARTSKMNMILHGDGHGGVHHHNGFVNINGVFEERFDVILTNPPFGSNVEPSDVLTDDQVTVHPDADRRYRHEYGDLYKKAQARVEAAKGKPIASLFELPKRGGDGAKIGKVKTEILFIERCLDLLKPGGRLGIVLPEGIFNNPSLVYVREFCEDRSRILAVVSLPQETFLSSGTSAKTSLMFLQKFTEKEKAGFEKRQKAALKEIDAKYADEIAAETARLEAAIEVAKKDKDADARKAAQGEMRGYLNRMADTKTGEARALLKERFDYPIFLYGADKVGITATGEPDANELYPNDRMPAGMNADRTCLVRYRSFRASREELDILATPRPTPNQGRIKLLDPTLRRGAFSLRWPAYERWDTFFWREDFVSLAIELAAQDSLTLGEILNFISRRWKSSDFPEGHFRYIEVSSVTREDGITGASVTPIDEAPSRATTLVRTGDFILSTTRPYLGGFARVTPEYDRCVCSSAFAVADRLLSDRVNPDYLLLFLKGPAGLRQMERRMTGGLYPAIIQRELEKIIIPLPDKTTQARIVRTLAESASKIKAIRAEANNRISKIEADADAKLLGG